MCLSSAAHPDFLLPCVREGEAGNAVFPQPGWQFHEHGFVGLVFKVNSTGVLWAAVENQGFLFTELATRGFKILIVKINKQTNK